MKYDFDEIINRFNTNCTKWDNLQNRMGNQNALALWVADTDFPVSIQIREAIARRAAHPVFGYSFIPNSFYTSVRRWVEHRHQWVIQEKDIRFFPGIVPFLGVGIRAITSPGDEVLILPPVYHPFKMMIEINGRVVYPCPLQFDGVGYSIDFDCLEKALSRKTVKALIFCNPHNPVGKVYTREELERIGMLCVRNNVTIISDEIHADIVFKGHKHIPIASINEEIGQNTVTCLSPSKAFNIAGLKASGIIISNKYLQEKIDTEINCTHVSTPNAFAIQAFEAAYNESEEYLDQLVPYLEGNVVFLDNYLKQYMDKIELVKPQGTYLMWLNCEKLGIGGDELHNFFTYDANVALNKGEIFGKEGYYFVRMNIACPKIILEKALSQIRAAYEKRFK